MPPDLAVDQIPVDDPTAFVLGGSGGLRRRLRGARGNWLGIGIVGLAVAIPLRGLYVTTGGTMEEGFMLYFPERMWEGDVPNVDFLHLYGPGALHVLMGWYEVFGFTLGAERTFGLLQHLGIIFGLYALARAWGRAAATAVATLSTLLILTPIGLTAMAWNGGLALTLWSAVFGVRAMHLHEPTARRNAWITAGVLAGLALTYRPDLVVAVGLVFGVVAVASPRGVAAGARGRARRGDPDVGARGDRRPERGVRGDVRRPGVQPAGRARAATAAELGSPRRRAAGDRRAGPAVVEAARPLGERFVVRVVLGDAGDHRRRSSGSRCGCTADPATRHVRRP